MNEFLKTRLDRKLESLSDERIYQVLDYIEFLESKYGAKQVVSPTAFQRLAETVEDTLRAGRVSASAIRGTMDAMSAAGRVMGGLAAAGKAVVDQVTTPRTPGPPEKGGTTPESKPETA